MILQTPYPAGNITQNWTKLDKIVLLSGGYIIGSWSGSPSPACLKNTSKYPQYPTQLSYTVIYKYSRSPTNLENLSAKCLLSQSSLSSVL